MQDQTNLNEKYLIWAILIVAFAIRFLGVWWGYPLLLHGDEKGEIVTGAYDILDFKSSGGVAPITHNGPLLKYLLALVFGTWGLIGAFFSSIDSMVALWKSSTIDTIVARVIVGVVPGTMAVWILHLAGRRFGGQITGLAAAFFLAVALKHVEFSHIATSDASAVLWATLVLYFSLRFVDTGQHRDLRWSAIFWAAAVATKLSAAPTIVMPVAAILLREGTSIRLRFSGLANLVLFGFAALLFFHLPYVTRPVELIRLVTTTLLVQTFYFKKGFFWFFRPDIYPAHEAPTAGIGVTLLVICIVGLLWSLLSPGRKRWIALAFPVVFYLIIGSSQVKLTRYFLPMVPFLCLWGGYFIARIHSLLPSRLSTGIRGVIIIMITIAIAWPNIFHSTGFSLQCADGNSIIEFDRDIRNIIPPNANWASIDYAPLVHPQRANFHAIPMAHDTRDAHMRESISQLRRKIPTLVNLMEGLDFSTSVKYTYFDTPLDSLVDRFGLTYMAISGTAVQSWYETPEKFLRYPQEVSVLRNTIRDLQTKWELVYKATPRYHQTWGETDGGRPPVLYLYRYPGNNQ